MDKSRNSSKDDARVLVVVYDRVVDVTEFLSKHPGGSVSIASRAGKDITAIFEQMGHSQEARQMVDSMSIGDASQEWFSRRQATTPGRGDIHHDSTYAVAWHGKRRAAIQSAHPGIAALFGRNPFTAILGVLVSLIHAAVCIWVQQGALGIIGCMVLAYTVGACCKMYMVRPRTAHYTSCAIQPKTSPSSLTHGPFRTMSTVPPYHLPVLMLGTLG